MVVGWYHSHPGFGCWLSGVDINTQQSFEALSERAVAVVIDPIQSVKGKVVIDAFRLINPNMMVRIPVFNSAIGNLFLDNDTLSVMMHYDRRFWDKNQDKRRRIWATCRNRPFRLWYTDWIDITTALALTIARTSWSRRCCWICTKRPGWMVLLLPNIRSIVDSMRTSFPRCLNSRKIITR